MTAAVGQNGLPTLLDLMKRMKPDGSIETQIVELLTQQYGILRDAVWKEGLLETGDRITRRSTVPEPELRRLNRGVSRAKSLTDQVDESVGLMEILSVVDVKLAKMSGNPGVFRMTEDVALRTGFNNKFERLMWYGNPDSNPDEWLGFSRRFLSTAATLTGGQMMASGISSSGNDQTDFWYIDWGLDTVHCIYPKNGAPGINSEDLGRDLVLDANGKEFRAFRTMLDMEAGLAVRDPRHVVRVYNIDTSAIAATGYLLIQGLVKGFHQLERGGRTVGYCNRKTNGYLHLQAISNAINGTITIADPTGMPVTHICGVPVRISDAINNTGASLS
jgi:hypothetical protein